MSDDGGPWGVGPLQCGIESVAPARRPGRLRSERLSPAFTPNPRPAPAVVSPVEPPISKPGRSTGLGSAVRLAGFSSISTSMSGALDRTFLVAAFWVSCLLSIACSLDVTVSRADGLWVDLKGCCAQQSPAASKERRGAGLRLLSATLSRKHAAAQLILAACEASRHPRKLLNLSLAFRLRRPSGRMRRDPEASRPPLHGDGPDRRATMVRAVDVLSVRFCLSRAPWYCICAEDLPDARDGPGPL